MTNQSAGAFHTFLTTKGANIVILIKFIRALNDTFLRLVQIGISGSTLCAIGDIRTGAGFAGYVA